MLQKKGKYWYVVINYKDGEKWKKKWIATGSESKREAKRQEKEIEYKAASGMTIYRAEKDIPALRQFLEKWLSITINPPARKPVPITVLAFFVLEKINKSSGPSIPDTCRLVRRELDPCDRVQYHEDYGSRVGYYFTVNGTDVVSIMRDDILQGRSQVYWKVDPSKEIISLTGLVYKCCLCSYYLILDCCDISVCSHGFCILKIETYCLCHLFSLLTCIKFFTLNQF